MLKKMGTNIKDPEELGKDRKKLEKIQKVMESTLSVIFLKTITRNDGCN